MLAIEIIFWVSIFVVLYSYAGYGMLIIFISKFNFLIKLLPKPANIVKSEYLVKPELPYYPTVSFIISASGESKEIIKEKIVNTFELIYPKEKLEIIFAIAYDTSSEIDETLEEFYDTFLTKQVDSGVSPVEEEVYLRFKKFENNKYKTDSFLSDIEKELARIKFTSEDKIPDAKEKLDEYFQADDSGDEIKIRVTKDIERKGKISQVNRTVKTAKGDILVFSDANSMFNKEALLNISRHFRNKQVGCVAGEKRVKKSEASTSGEGEGLYWKYESLLKKTDSKIWTTVGAAGEIFAIRKELWGSGIEGNAIIEDFVISLRVAQKGYRVVYEPDAYAEEEPTFEVKEEFIRRRRIAAGGFQSIVWLKALLNPFKYRILTFQYVSHRVLRWAVVPFLLPIIFVLNLFILIDNFNIIYFILLLFQSCFYLFALIGYMLEKKRKKIKIFYLPFVLTMMNWAAYVGLKRYIKGQQKVVWERAKR